MKYKGFRVPEASADHLLIPSWRVTPDMLKAWGIPLAEKDEWGGTLGEGLLFSDARRAAYIAGWTRVETMPEAVREIITTNPQYTFQQDVYDYLTRTS